MMTFIVIPSFITINTIRSVTFNTDNTRIIEIMDVSDVPSSFLKSLKSFGLKESIPI